MALRINSNISAMNGHRQLLNNDMRLGKSLERLASGLKVNRASDGPASLVISEQMRAQISGLEQAIENSETAVGMVQTTEAALFEISNLLISMRQLSLHAANQGANDSNMLEADQLEFDNALDTIDRITANAQYGHKKLLDGSTAANGVGIGQGLEFISASPTTRSSPIEGFEVRVNQLGSRAHMSGSVALTQELLDAGEEFTITQGGKSVSIVTNAEDSVDQVVGNLRNDLEKNGLEIELTKNEDGTLSLIHKQYGGEHAFSASTSTAGILSTESRVMEQANSGQDIRGTIGGEIATGKGQTLTGSPGTKVDGLEVRYVGEVTTAPDAGEGVELAGRVAVYQNSPIFQTGSNAGQSVAVSLVNTNTRTLGRGVEIESDFKSLQDIDLRSQQGAVDAQRMVDKAINEITSTRARMGAFQKNTLESNLRQLRVNVEELSNAESVVRDADMAKEVTEFTRNKIMVESATAMLAQANQTPKTILQLLA